jgi:DNA-binding transcriptional LysR family regulator
MRILIILNADSDSQASAVREFDGLIEAYYLFCDAGIDVVVAALGGGSAGEATWTGSRRDEIAAPDAIRRFKADRQARDVMNDLLDLASVCAGDFDAAVCFGPPRFDGSAGVKDQAGVLVAQLLATTKPVAVIASVHAYAALDAGNGLLIFGNSNDARRLAANALLGAIGVR